MNSQSPSEQLEGLKRSCDQMISQHSFLRDMYSGRASAIDIALLVMSASLSALIFAPDELISKVLFFVVDPKLIIGFIALAVFILSMVSWKVDWKGMENAHREAAILLSELKQEINARQRGRDPVNADAVPPIQAEYKIITDKCIRIPERYFLKTKQHHKQKIALSRIIDEKPHINIKLAKIKLWFSDNW